MPRAHPTRSDLLRAAYARSRPGASKIGAALVCAGLAVAPRDVRAQGLRLRGDAFAQTPSPVGLLVLRGEGRRQTSDRLAIDAETVTWLGVGAGGGAPIARGAGGVSGVGGDGSDPAATGDVLTLTVRVRDVASGSEARAGRMLVSMGAVRPLHLDGARALARLPVTGTIVEAFGGVPVSPRFAYASFDWAAGARVAQPIHDAFVMGAAYQQRRTRGRPADEEIGVDAAFTPSARVTAAGRASFDLLTYGVTDALLSVSTQTTPSMREGSMRLEGFMTHRSPGRLLPSTSLFSVLGDFAATTAGGTVRYRAFPRLDLVGTGSAVAQGGTWGGQGTGRAQLALDDEWAGTMALELRRVDVPLAAWSGARGILSLPVSARVRLGAELELVVPDRDDTRDERRGTVWPWGLASVGYALPSGWDLAAAVEAASGPEHTRRTAALLRASWSWGQP